jgi:beta-glucosidase
LNVPKAPVTAGDTVVASVTVANTGKLAGDEVVQLYLSFPKVPGAPIKALRGFQRVHLEPGTSQEIKFELKPRDLCIVTQAGEPVIPEGDFALSIEKSGSSTPAFPDVYRRSLFLCLVCGFTL